MEEPANRTREASTARNILYAVLSGTLWLLAMISGSTGFGSAFIWIAFVPLIVAARERSRKTVLYFAISFCVGSGIYLALLSIQPWMYGFAVVFPLVLAGLTALMWRFACRSSHPSFRAVVMILFAMVLDWAVASTPVTAVISPAITQAGTIFLAPAGLAGFPLVTGLIVTVNVLVYFMLFSRRRALILHALIGAAVVCAVFAVAWLQPSWRYSGNSLRVSALDSGMSPGGLHAPPEELARERTRLTVPEGLYWELTRQAEGEITVWPEKFYPRDLLAHPADMEALKRATDKCMIVPFLSAGGNMAMPLTRDGFDKPYVKMRPAGIVGERGTGGTEQPVYTLEDRWRYGLLICFDMHFEEYSRRLVQSGAEMVLVPSVANALVNSMGWVKRTASVRAVETGVPFAVSTDIGAYVIDHRGKVIAESHGRTPTVVTGEVMPNSVGTFYTRGGCHVRWFFLALLVVLCALLVKPTGGRRDPPLRQNEIAQVSRPTPEV